MLEKIKYKKYLLLATLVTMSPTFAFASDTSATQITAALTTVADDIKAVFAAIAPVALGIATLGIAWRYGMRFFKSLSK